MNIFSKVFIVVVALAVVTGLSKTYLSESRAAEGQEQPISWLEDKARAQDEIIAWHKAMRDNAGRGSLSSSEGPSGSGFAIMEKEMQSHCDEIIKAAEALKKELQSFADWHKDKLVLKTQRTHAD